jgi:alpha,alpha-trehalose phosphorylase
LSSCTQSVLAAETGHLELAHDYLGEAALMDLHDIHSNTREGLHIAALAGAWIALVAGLGGMRDHGDVLEFAPRLPDRINLLEFSLMWRGLRLKVSVQPHEVTYSLRDGADDARMPLRHHGELVNVTCAESVTRAIPPLPHIGPTPTQPAGRAPARRAPSVDHRLDPRPDTTA